MRSSRRPKLELCSDEYQTNTEGGHACLLKVMSQKKIPPDIAATKPIDMALRRQA